MIAAKREFHRQAQEVRTPSKVLFSDMDADSDGFEDVTSVPLLSPFKPSVAASLPGLVGQEKKLAKHVHLAEDSLSVVTQNLIYQRGALKDQDKTLRGLETRLDCVQDHLGMTPNGMSFEFEPPTLNGRVALLADKFASWEGLGKPAEPQVLERQVQEWINKGWSAHKIHHWLRSWDSFTVECESFLGNMISAIRVQTTNIAMLMAQTEELA
jgi:hypothetical protein